MDFVIARRLKQQSIIVPKPVRALKGAVGKVGARADAFVWSS